MKRQTLGIITIVIILILIAGAVFWLNPEITGQVTKGNQEVKKVEYKEVTPQKSDERIVLEKNDGQYKVPEGTNTEKFKINEFD